MICDKEKLNINAYIWTSSGVDMKHKNASPEIYDDGKIINTAFNKYKLIVIVGEILIPLVTIALTTYFYLLTDDIAVWGIGAIVGSLAFPMGILPLKRSLETAVPKFITCKDKWMILHYLASTKNINIHFIQRIDINKYKKDWIIIKIYSKNQQTPLMAIVDNKTYEFLHFCVFSKT